MPAILTKGSGDEDAVYARYLVGRLVQVGSTEFTYQFVVLVHDYFI